MGIAAPRTLAERVDWLFKNMTKPDGTEYSYQEVEVGTERLGYRITATGVWKIRQGQTLNPGYLALRALAQFFDVDVLYFYEDQLTRERLKQMKLAASLREAGVEEIALRASRLDEAGRQAILNMIRYIAETQGQHENPGAEANGEPDPHNNDPNAENLG